MSVTMVKRRIYLRLIDNISLVYLNYYWYDSSKDPGENIEKAIEFSLKTLAFDDNNGSAHGTLSQVYLQKREYDAAIAEGERAVGLDPSSPWTAFQYAKALVYSGRPEQAIPLLEKAIRLNPLAPSPS